MSDLFKFFNEFSNSGIPGRFDFVDEHTFRFFPNCCVLSQVLFDFVSKNCPSSCRYYVSFDPALCGTSLYLCVYDDYLK